MGKLRDFFAAVGFCESTADLERKPALIDEIVKYSLYYADPQNEFMPSSGYEERMRLALSGSTAYELSRLIEEKVIVCLDQRLSRMEEGFWDDDVYALYYNKDGQKVIGLYDNGKNERDTGFFETGITDHSSDAIEKLIEDVLDGGASHRIMVCTSHYNAASKTTSYEWHRSGEFSDELRKNRELLSPPLKSSAVNAPALYSNSASVLQPGP